MSFYVTCTNYDGKIVGFIDFALNPKCKYEVAVVEIIYSLEWLVNFGSFGLEIEGSKIFKPIVDYDYSYLDSLQFTIDDIIDNIREKFRTRPVIKYDYSKKLLSFESNNPKIHFICDDIFRNNLRLPSNKFSSFKVHTSAKLERTRYCNIFCDIIADQFIGVSRAKLLRSFRVEGEAFKLRSNYFTNPFYMNVARTDFRYIYLDILDQNNQSIKFEKEIFVKLHFRVKQ